MIPSIPAGDTLYFLRAGRLARDLAGDRVSTRDKLKYLIAGWLFFTVLSYSAILPSPMKWGWLVAYEFVLVVLITIYGSFRCFERAGGDANREFLVDFTCLLLPVSVSTYLLVWGSYSIFWHGFNWAVVSLVDLGYFDGAWSEAYNRQISDFRDLVRFLAVVLTELVIFIRISIHLGSISENRASSLPRSSDAG